jgi:uncharacterized protein YkwD
MKKISLILVLITTFSFFSCEKDENTVAPSALDNEILKLINDHRKTLGKAELQFDAVIFEQALNHSTNMAKGTTPFGHDGFSARTAAIRETLSGNGSAAENVASGYTTAQAVVNGWLGSSGHKANIEGDYNKTAVSAVKSSDGTMYYTQFFYKQ